MSWRASAPFYGHEVTYSKRPASHPDTQMRGSMQRLPAIPTTYLGVKYRSRLEARWAAMFDALGWTYAYEPIELAGYIPDFLITSGPGATEPMLVECKPFVDAAKGDAQDAAALAQRISRAWHGQALIVGAVHHVESDETGSRIRVGRIRGPLYLGKSKVSATKGAHWRDAYLARTDNTWSLDTDRCEHTSLCSLDVMTARMAWCDAGNVTQWKAPA